MSERAEQIIERLGLTPHPEGGFFRETHRSPTMLSQDALPEGYGGTRSVMTSILFLLRSGERSAWHRVKSEELWMHQGGDALDLRIQQVGGDVDTHRLESEGRLQAVVPAGLWQDATAIEGPHGYALVGCVVAPGFEFEDFEMRG